ncbi:MAG: indole-3-glycerol-phosphate synthase [Gemmatimonadaceae bacterium]|nr:indole-3-glycerol-phosphate synthase [Gemmatimonadaceae bacterium]
MTEAQATSGWVPATGPLGDLTLGSEARATALAADPARIAALEAEVAARPAPPPFATALRGGTVRVIAELKRRSPSKGVINDGLDAPARAAAYAAGGAAALSILTEPTRFGGALEDLAAVGGAVAIPRLRKDFITHELQLLEARACGASAVLLIARALPPARLRGLALAARARGLECLVEVRSPAELEVALDVPDAVVGVNNRNLETLVIDDAVGRQLLPLVPPDRVAVYESGVTSVADVERAAAFGADAVLVGSVLSASPDGAAAVRALSGVVRRGRG